MFFNFKKKKAEKQTAATAKQAEEQKKINEAKQDKTSAVPTKTKATANVKGTKATPTKAEASAVKTSTTKSTGKTDTKSTPKVSNQDKPKTTTDAKSTKKATEKTAPKSETKPAKPAGKVEAAKPAAKEQDYAVVQNAANGPKGKFVYYRTAKGFYNYRLKASNNETIAVSGGTGYAALSGCKAGIESVRKNINAPVEDQTLKTYETLPNPKFVIFKDKAGKFRYRLFARNGELICTPEDGYSSKDACKKGMASLAKWAANSEIVSED